MIEKRKISFRKVLKGSPSKAIRAMVAGLREPKILVRMAHFARDEDLIDLSPYNHRGFSKSDKPICYGCAAAATILEIFPHRIDRYSALYQESDIGEFECVIDDLRKGDLSSLLQYFKVDFPDIDLRFLPRLQTNYSKKDLLCYEELANKLETFGL